jgi:cobalt/nickel transport system ATP-binding protein
MPGVHGGHHGPVPVPRTEQDDEPLDPAAPAPGAPFPPPTHPAHQNGPLPAFDRASVAHGHGDADEAPTGEPILEAEGVTFAYPDGTIALRDLTVRLPRNRRVAILGANGSGKSTLFLTLNGILKPTHGRVLLGGQPVRYDRAGLNDLRRRVGLVFQDPDSQLFAASVRQDISFGPLNLGLPEAAVRERVATAIADTQIEELADRPTHLLSYGQKKRVAIAGVLAMGPDVIVADEPTAGLDPEATARLLHLLNRLHESGRTIVISTHDVELALAWADEVRVLRRGELLAQGAPERVFSDTDLLRSARLLPPIVLDTFARLQARGLLPANAPPPRTGEALVELLAQARAAQRGMDRAAANSDAVRSPSLISGQCHTP